MTIAPPLSTGESRLPDDVDALLQAYFRAEMPDPWPAPPLVRTTLAELDARPMTRGSGRSRLALAASVTLLIAGTMALPMRTPPSDKAPTLRLSPGMAEHVNVTETLIQPKDKPTELHFQVIEDTPVHK